MLYTMYASIVRLSMPMRLSRTRVWGPPSDGQYIALHLNSGSASHGMPTSALGGHESRVLLVQSRKVTKSQHSSECGNGGSCLEVIGVLGQKVASLSILFKKELINLVVKQKSIERCYDGEPVFVYGPNCTSHPWMDYCCGVVFKRKQLLP
jgi:hypothetical protein